MLAWESGTEYERIVTDAQEFKVDYDHVSSIKLFPVHGEMNYVPWFRVRYDNDDEKVVEVNGKFVVIAERRVRDDT